MANNDITVTLANGEVITILAGQSTGTTTTPIQGDDVYIDGETITNLDRQCGGGERWHPWQPGESAVGG